MAPIRKKRTSMRSRASSSHKSSNATNKPVDIKDIAVPILPGPPIPGAVLRPPNSRYMREKRLERALLAPRDRGITKSSQTNAQRKRRRPGKKLLAMEDIDEMRDALPDLSDEGVSNEWVGFSDEDTATQASTKRRRRRGQAAEGKIRMQSLIHRPGAMKRKRRMEGVEMERFGRNLAQLSANTKAKDDEAKGDDGGGGGGTASAGEKWAALRAFIGSTMERKDGFEKS